MSKRILKRQLDKTKTKKEFKRALWIYDLWGGLTERKAARKVLELARIKNGSTILDVACGTGDMLNELVVLNPAGKNIGMDLSPDMLTRAEKKLNKHHLVNYQLYEGNALHLNFSDNSFDLLINNYMVDLLPEKTFDKVAAEFYRVLKPGGKVAISTFSFGTKKIHGFWFWMAKTFPGLLTGCRPVAFKKYLMQAGFNIENQIEISQNTFPSQILVASKPEK